MKDTVIISTEDCVEYCNEIYFFSQKVNLLCRIDRTDSSVSIVSSMPDENFLSQRLCSKIIRWKNELVFVPLNAKKIWKYNIVDGSWKGYEINDIENYKNAFFQAVLRNDMLYIIGCHYPAIVILDLISGDMRYIYAPFEEIKQINRDSDFYFRSDYVIRGDSVYLASCNTNMVLKYDFKEETYELISVGEADDIYIGIDYSHGNFWLTSGKDNYLVMWDGKNCSKKIKPERNYCKNERNFGGCICYENKVIGWAYFDKSSIVYDINNATIKEYRENFSFMKRYNDNLIWGDKSGKIFYCKNGKIMNEFSCELSKDNLRKYIKDAKLDVSVKDNIFLEDIFELEDFLHYFVL